jgi:hypothetical protein
MRGCTDELERLGSTSILRESKANPFAKLSEFLAPEMNGNDGQQYAVFVPFRLLIEYIRMCLPNRPKVHSFFQRDVLKS